MKLIITAQIPTNPDPFSSPLPEQGTPTPNSPVAHEANPSSYLEQHFQHIADLIRYYIKNITTLVSIPQIDVTEVSNDPQSGYDNILITVIIQPNTADIHLKNLSKELTEIFAIKHNNYALELKQIHLEDYYFFSAIQKKDKYKYTISIDFARKIMNNPEDLKILCLYQTNEIWIQYFVNLNKKLKTNQNSSYEISSDDQLAANPDSIYYQFAKLCLEKPFLLNSINASNVVKLQMTIKPGNQTKLEIITKQKMFFEQENYLPEASEPDFKRPRYW